MLPVTARLLLVNILQQDDKFTQFAQIAKQIIVILKITHLTVRFSLLANLSEQNGKSIKFV